MRIEACVSWLPNIAARRTLTTNGGIVHQTKAVISAKTVHFCTNIKISRREMLGALV